MPGRSGRESYGPSAWRTSATAPKVTIYRYWDVGPVQLSVASDEAGSVTSISGRIAEGDTKARMSLPDELVLGEATMADVLRVNGPPFDMDTTEGENIVIYSYVYREGGEGHERVRFSVGAEAGSSQDPGGFNAALRGRLVETFEVGY